jgi:Cft2 family RNA processing exonuclease
VDDCSLILDCGIRPHDNSPPNLSKIENIDAIIVSHAHLDHIGALPLLHMSFPDVKCFTTLPTRSLIKTMLYDAIKVMGSRNELESEVPIYSESIVDSFISTIQGVDFMTPFKPINGTITTCFLPAGHILGASLVYFNTRQGNIIYTGDFSLTKQLTVDKASIQKITPDLLIIESTYGNRIHSPRENQVNELLKIIKDVIEKGGRVLIPAFALGRSQEILLLLRQAFDKKILPKFDVYYDGLVRSICKSYIIYPDYASKYLRNKIAKERNPFRTSNIIGVDLDTREKILSSNKPCCIIASSGMLSGGVSPIYAKVIASDEKNLIAFTGYQDEESPGHKLLKLKRGDNLTLINEQVTTVYQHMQIPMIF